MQDPFIGWISDRFAAQRYTIISIGVILLALGMLLLFALPFEHLPALSFTIGLVLATTGFSVVAINLNMIGGFWHTDSHQRTRISGTREIFGLSGLLIAAALPTLLQLTFEPRLSFMVIFFVFAALLGIAFLMFTRFMSALPADHPVKTKSTESVSKNSLNLALLRILSGPDKTFFLICFFTHLAAAFPGVLVLFYIRDYLGAEEFSGGFLILYFLSGALLMPLWITLSKRIGAERAWLMSMCLAIMTFIWAFLLQPGQLIAYAAICVLSGLALGADLALPPAILAKRVSDAGDEGAATQYYALLAFIPKAALALASGIAFMTLDHWGFVAATENDTDALWMLCFFYALAPCLLKALSAGLLFWSLPIHVKKAPVQAT